MKLREKPDDFIVREIPTHTWKTEGKYAIYEITKVGLTTYAAQKIFANKCKVPFQEVGLAGLKDTHAKTTQYFSTPAKTNGTFKDPHITSTHVGYSDKPLRTGDLKGNEFTITVRSLGDGDIRKAQNNINTVKTGVPNYFDSQRFGSLKGTQGFIAKDIIQGNYSEALKKAITSFTRQKPSKIKKARRYIASHWGDWNTCLNEVKNLRAEERIIIHLAKNPNDYKGAFKKIFSGIKELYFSAYKSYIWNECVKMIVKENSEETFGVPYEAGKLTFPSKWNPISGNFPLLDPDIDLNKYPQLKKILEKENLQLNQFKIDEYTFKPQERPITVKPEKLEIKFDEDERNLRKKATIKFTLQKGSYATIIIKALFES